MDEVVGGDGFPNGWSAPAAPRLRDLRRVVPIVADGQDWRGRHHGLLSLDDFAEGFTVRLRLLLADEHPVAEEQRRQEAAFQHQRAEAVRRGALEADSTLRRRRRPSSPGSRRRSLPEPEVLLEARDDRGRQYRNWGGERAWGSILEAAGGAELRPGAGPGRPGAAADGAEVQWRTVAVWERGEVVAVDRGPWAFTVAL